MTNPSGEIRPTLGPEDMEKVREAFKSATGQEMTPESVGEVLLTPLFARPGEERSAPTQRLNVIPESPEVAYQIIHDTLMLDGNARQNLATFVTTWMDEYADKLFTRDVRQEHDRQRRVPDDRRHRTAVHQHHLRPVARARGPHWDVDRRAPPRR